MNEIDRLLKKIEKTRADAEKKKVNKNLIAEADLLHDIADNTVTKSNALSRAYYRFSLIEKRCMEALISKLNPMRSDNELQDLELTVIEYRRAFPDSGEHIYKQLANAVSALMHRVITISHGDERRELTLMVEAVYKPKEGKIVATFSSRIVPHLLGLRAKFSSYPLKKAVDFRSSYTWRFYEILVSWIDNKKTNGQFVGWIDRQSIEELKEMLGVPSSYQWGNFQEQVLNVVQNELKDKANIYVHFERIKTSRKITHLNIKYIENDQQKIPL